MSMNAQSADSGSPATEDKAVTTDAGDGSVSAAREAAVCENWADIVQTEGQLCGTTEGAGAVSGAACSPRVPRGITSNASGQRDSTAEGDACSHVPWDRLMNLDWKVLPTRVEGGRALQVLEVDASSFVFATLSGHSSHSMDIITPAVLNELSSRFVRKARIKRFEHARKPHVVNMTVPTIKPSGMATIMGPLRLLNDSECIRLGSASTSVALADVWTVSWQPRTGRQETGHDGQGSLLNRRNIEHVQMLAARIIGAGVPLPLKASNSKDFIGNVMRARCFKPQEILAIVFWAPQITRAMGMLREEEMQQCGAGAAVAAQESSRGSGREAPLVYGSVRILSRCETRSWKPPSHSQRKDGNAFSDLAIGSDDDASEGGQGDSRK